MSKREPYDPSHIALLYEPKTGLDCTFSGDIPFGVLTFGFVAVDARRESLESLNDFRPISRMFRHLQFRGQWERNQQIKGVYAQQLRMANIHELTNGRETRELADMLERVNRIRFKLPCEPVSYGQFVVLMLRGLKVRQAVQTTKLKESRAYPSLQDWEFRSIGIGRELQGMIDRTIEETYFHE